MLHSIVDICGDTNICNNLVDGYQSTPIGGGLFAEKTHLKIYGNTNISNNSVLKNNDETRTYGGGIGVNNGIVNFTTEKNIEISGNVIISNNSAERGGGVYVQAASGSSGMALQIADDVIISQNEAVYGGGINSFLPVYLQNNTTLIENVASLGGGIYLSSTSDPIISVSGEDTQTVSFLSNFAEGNGGAVYISGIGTLSKYQLFEKTASSNLRFSENIALRGYLWNLADPDLETNMTYIRDNLPVMENTEFTEPFTHAYNNFDIVFINEGEVIVPVVVEYFADSTEEDNLLDAAYFLCYEGDELNDSNFESFFGTDWLNLYQPNDYDPGQLQESLPLTIGAGTVLTVLYQESAPTPVTATITIEYFADSANTAILNSESFIVNEGTELNTAVIESNLGSGWLDLYQPSGYKAGQLQETLPLTVTDDTVLSVLYLPNNDGSSGGSGGSGTGSAKVSDPNPINDEIVLDQDSSVQQGFESEPPEPEESDVIVFLFSIAIACYPFAAKREFE